MVVVGAVALLRRDDKSQNVRVDPAASTSTTANTTPGSVIPSAGAPSIWPFASMNRTFATPEEAAKSFAVEYLGMTQAHVGKTEPGYEYETNVEIFPNDRAGIRTVVRVTNYSQTGFVVLGAAGDEIQVERPTVMENTLTSPLTVSGRSRAFEAQINLQLRPYGSTTPVAEGFTMGGGTEILPFSTTITPPSTDQPLVLVVFEGDASGQGAMSQATVIQLAAAGAAAPTTFVGQATNGDLNFLDFAGHVQRAATVKDKTDLENPATLPTNVKGSIPALRGRFGTVAFYDGLHIASYNPSTGGVVQLVQPPAQPISLDADESGRHLLWVDVNHDLWKWSGNDPVKIGTGFTSAAW
jgi:hypothetical protein